MEQLVLIFGTLFITLLTSFSVAALVGFAQKRSS